MSNFSPQNLSHREVKACSKALAVMIYRFVPMDNNHFYGAQKISEQVGGLPNGQISTLYVEPDTLKKALANKRLRDGLLHLLPGKIVLDRSCSRFNIITEGPYAFQKGYQVKLLSPAYAEDSDDCFRSEISRFQGLRQS